MTHWIRNNILDFLRAMHEHSGRKWKDLQQDDDERDCRELMRFGLLMRRIALDWTLSRRWREDLGAPPKT